MMQVIKKLKRVSGHMYDFMTTLLERTESSSSWLQDVNHSLIAFPLGNVGFPSPLATELFPLNIAGCVLVALLMKYRFNLPNSV